MPEFIAASAPTGAARTPLRLLAAAVSAGSLVLLGAGSALATDYIHECEPVGRDRTYQHIAQRGSAELVLQRSNSTDKINYDNMVRHTLREIVGTCTNNNAKRRYRFKTEVYGITLEFTDRGQKLTRKFRCERASDEAPAAAKCDREVRSIDYSAPESRMTEYK